MSKGPEYPRTEKTLINFTRPQLPDLPIKVTMDHLTETEGRGLMQVARGTRKLVEAVMFVYPWEARWDDDYARAKKDYLLNLSISMNGDGRNELVACLDAGGQIPDGYYSQDGSGGKRGDTGYLRRED